MLSRNGIAIGPGSNSPGSFYAFVPSSVSEKTSYWQFVNRVCFAPVAYPYPSRQRSVRGVRQDEADNEEGLEP